jgi:hypothetical protein
MIYIVLINKSVRFTQQYYEKSQDIAGDSSDGNHIMAGERQRRREAIAGYCFFGYTTQN